MIVRVPRLVLAGAVALAGAAALAALSNAPYTADPLEHAVLRLAWRARGERVRLCRHLTPDELASLPAHMRQEEVCERRVLPYRLRVTVDQVTLVDEVVRAGGAREDRPLFVFRELPLVPGTHAVRVTFEREEGGAQAAGGGTETPPRLELDRTIALPARRIVLITYDDETKSLRLAGGP